jgi:ABC-type lipoprotein export system ATPase subunit
MDLFKIKNLMCAYQEKGKRKPVLYIPELTIERGKLVFVLGVSGIGKSTLIETLGLMNNTIANPEGCEIRFMHQDEQQTELSKLWSVSNNEISAFRNEHFSFVFQQNNLMPNFTAGENASVSQLIRGNELEDVKERVLEVMRAINLKEELYYRKIAELSGGERQRLCFIRAVTASYDVLFGDEPTGNLDAITAGKLMSFTQKQLGNKSAIVVSHDISLALKFADNILIMVRSDFEGDKVGQILQKNILTKDKDGNWINSSNEKIGNPYQLIYSILEKETILV